jgi:formate--tetrahydrofolate ligase
MLPLVDVAAKLSIPADALEFYGRDKAKLARDYLPSLATRPKGKLVLVTAINPTPAGEGKTTTSIGLADALSQLGHKVALALREPSLGPCFGQKGGATGGGRARVEPADDINLHFTGDFHAITSAHNLIAAVLDNQFQFGNPLGLDPRQVLWRRVMDMNDRALRQTVIGLGGSAQGTPRETGFDITTASELMAVVCLAKDEADLRLRLERMVLGFKDDAPVCVGALKITGALMALLKDAIRPNLVQSAEGTPAFIHGGPFANIAHGCNSVIATQTALSLADWVVTEAGFGADLGAEKFLDIKCRSAGLQPVCAVIVATIRALKYNGGVAVADLAKPDPAAIDRGMPNLLRHCNNLQQYGLPIVVALNRFASDSDEEIATVQTWCKRNFIPISLATHYTEGGAGATDLANAVLNAAREATPVRLLYPDGMGLLDKISTVAQKIYHATGVEFSPPARAAAARFTAAGYGELPVCIAKTQYSFSDEPAKLGAPREHVLHVRELRLSAGAGFVVAMAGTILLMPGLPKVPAAHRIELDAQGRVQGLMSG